MLLEYKYSDRVNINIAQVTSNHRTRKTWPIRQYTLIDRGEIIDKLDRPSSDGFSMDGESLGNRRRTWGRISLQWVETWHKEIKLHVFQPSFPLDLPYLSDWAGPSSSLEIFVMSEASGLTEQLSLVGKWWLFGGIAPAKSMNVS